MPPSSISFQVAYQTDTGRTRDTNEDSLAAVPDWGVYIVADGVGGLSAGDVASRNLCDTIEKTCDTFQSVSPLTAAYMNSRLRAAVNQANDWIRNEAERRESRGMGTTMVTLFFDPEKVDPAICLHAGDSRLYRLRDDGLKQLSVDHSIAGQLGVDESELHPYMQGVITRAVGIQADVGIEETAVDVQPGDLFLVCSDGLTRMVPDLELLEMLNRKTKDRSLNDLANEMVQKANDAGGYDNITLILIEIESA